MSYNIYMSLPSQGADTLAAKAALPHPSAAAWAPSTSELETKPSS
jgi:hypothetical protein